MPRYAETPTARLLILFLVLAPLTYLVADVLYAVRGWDDPTAAVFHVLGAVGYSFALLALVTMLDERSRWAAALLFVSMVGVAGNVAYGFNTIHVSLGDTDLVDASGAATLIKPLGLCFPLALVLGAVALHRVGLVPPWATTLLGLAGLLWPVAHIANIGWLAVLVNLALVASLAEVARSRTTREEPSSDESLMRLGSQPGGSSGRRVHAARTPSPNPDAGEIG